MIRKALDIFRGVERPRQCPNCRSTTDTRAIRNVSNAVRVSLDVTISLIRAIAGMFLFILMEDEGEHIPLTRKCHRCGSVFTRGRIKSRRLDECVRCGYSLIGNVSGVCPECGWKLRRAHKRFVRKRGTGMQNQPRQPPPTAVSDPSAPVGSQPERENPADKL